MHYALINATDGQTRPDYSLLPRLSAEDANKITYYHDPSEALQFLLGHAMLPDIAMVALATVAGPGGTQHLTHNRTISEDLWCGAYSATSGIGRWSMVKDRALSQRQRHHLVHVERERSPYVLAYATHLLTDADLASLAELKLRQRSRNVVESELAARRAGESEVVARTDGRGVVELRHAPGTRAEGDPAQWTVLETDRAGSPLRQFEDDPKRSAQAFGLVLSEYLIEQLGEDYEAWCRLAELLNTLRDRSHTLTWEHAVAQALPAAA